MKKKMGLFSPWKIFCTVQLFAIGEAGIIEFSVANHAAKTRLVPKLLTKGHQRVIINFQWTSNALGGIYKEKELYNKNLMFNSFFFFF